MTVPKVPDMVIEHVVKDHLARIELFRFSMVVTVLRQHSSG
jgi:hypothetical protein